MTSQGPGAEPPEPRFPALRVLHVATAFPRSPADLVSHWLVELLRRLRERGVDVEVFTSAYKGAGDHTHAGIPVRRFRYFIKRWENLTHEEAAPDRVRRSMWYRLIAVFYMLGGMLAVWRLCRRERYDIVHVHWPLPLALFGWVARRACGACIVTTFYGVEFRWSGSLPFVRRFLAWAARDSARAVAISSHTAQELMRIVPTPVEIIPYGIGISESPGAATRLERRPGFNVLFVGRLVERKGVAYLIRALARLPLDVDARLVIVGDGSERPVLEEVARREGVGDRVEFWGKVPHASLEVAYGSADVFVLPSVVDSRGDTEGLGVVLLEAMSYRMPVIATAVGGITDIVHDGRTGILVPPNDAEAIAEAIQRLARDPAGARALGEAGYQHLRERFGWDGIVERWLRVYSDVASGAGARS